MVKIELVEVSGDFQCCLNQPCAQVFASAADEAARSTPWVCVLTGGASHKR